MSTKQTKDGKEVRAGDVVYLPFARHENPLNVHFSLRRGEVVAALGRLLVVNEGWGNLGVADNVEGWFSSVEAAKLAALADAEKTFTTFRACVRGARCE